MSKEAKSPMQNPCAALSFAEPTPSWLVLTQTFFWVSLSDLGIDLLRCRHVLARARFVAALALGEAAAVERAGEPRLSFHRPIEIDDRSGPMPDLEMDDAAEVEGIAEIGSCLIA